MLPPLFQIRKASARSSACLRRQSSRTSSSSSSPSLMMLLSSLHLVVIILNIILINREKRIIVHSFPLRASSSSLMPHSSRQYGSVQHVRSSLSSSSSSSSSSCRGRCNRLTTASRTDNEENIFHRSMDHVRRGAAGGIRKKNNRSVFSSSLFAGAAADAPDASSSTSTKTLSSTSSPATKTTTTTDKLLESIDSKAEEDVIRHYVQELESKRNQMGSTSSKSDVADQAVVGENNTSNVDDDEDEGNTRRFESLLGLYDVKYVLKARDGENPVGGKWTRQNGIAQMFLRTRRTLQHLIPIPVNTTPSTGSFSAGAVAEAINVISLEAFLGLIRCYVILRGDAVPLTSEERRTFAAANNNTMVPSLSKYAVRAWFDPPRIIFGKRGRFINLNIGPTSSVVLDATYCDDKVRIGMGGTSGTRFVFQRCSDDDMEANEFRALLARTPTRKIKAVATLFALTASGLYTSIFVATKQRLLAPMLVKIIGSTISVFGLFATALVTVSGGGIERNDISYRAGKELEQKIKEQQEQQAQREEESREKSESVP